MHSVKRVEVVNPLVKPVHAVLVLKTHQTDRKGTVPLCTNQRLPRVCLRVLTCGSPVRMEERLGEQLLTEVKALLNTRLRRARERR